MLCKGGMEGDKLSVSLSSWLASVKPETPIYLVVSNIHKTDLLIFEILYIFQWC